MSNDRNRTLTRRNFVAGAGALAAYGASSAVASGLPGDQALALAATL